HPMARAMKLLQKLQSIDDRRQVRRKLLGNSERMETAERVAVLQQLFVADREQRAAQDREHRQLVFRPFDGRQGGAQRFDLGAVVKRAAADEQMRDAARFESLDV